MPYTFEIYKDKKEEFRVRFIAPNGEKMFRLGRLFVEGCGQQRDQVDPEERSGRDGRRQHQGGEETRKPRASAWPRDEPRAWLISQASSGVTSRRL